MENRERELHDRLVRLYDDIFAEAHAGERVPTSPLDVKLGMPPLGQSPWEGASAEEREEFRVWASEPYEDVLTRAYAQRPTLDIDAAPNAGAVLNDELDFRPRLALLKLVEWDVRHLFTPTGYWFVRNAQLANDQTFFEDLGNRMRANARYGETNSRAQRRLNRVLYAVTIGGRRSFNDSDFRERIRVALWEIYYELELSEKDPAWGVLNSVKTFNRHLRRLHLLEASEP